MNNKIFYWVFIASGFVPFLFLLGKPSDVMLLIYSVFVAAVFFRKGLSKMVRGINLNPYLKFLLLLVAVGLLAEFLAWSTNFLARSPEPALFHPQLIPNLIIGIGFYSGWAIAWSLVLRKFRFSLLSVFVTMGFFGVFFEQDGAVLLAIIELIQSNPLFALVMAVYVFVVYGSVIGIAFLAIEKEIPIGQSRHWIRFPIALLLIYVFMVIVSLIWFIIVSSLGLIPEPRPIWEFPFF